MGLGGGYGGNYLDQLLHSGTLQQMIDKQNPFPSSNNFSQMFVPQGQGSSQPSAPGYSSSNGMPGTGNTYGPPMPAQQPQLTPLQQLQQQLQQQLSSLNISNFLTPESNIQTQANGAVNSQYDPQINGLLNNIQQQKTQTKQNQGDATNMYNALAENLSSQIPAMQQQSQQAQQSAGDLYAGAKQDMSQQYQGQQAQQQATLAQLGLQAATGGGSSGNTDVQANSPTGGVGQQAANDQSYAQSQADLQNQQAQNQLKEQGASDQQYQTSMADNSRLAGANTVEDLGRQLASYLTGANSQVTQLQSSKAQALQSMIAQLDQSNQQNAQTQYQNAFNNTMATNNFGLDALKESDSNTNAANTLAQQLLLAQQKNNPALTTGPTGAANYLAQQYQSNPNEAVKINQLIQDTMGRQDVMNGVHNVNGANASNNQEYLIAQLRDQAAKEGITDQTDLNNAINAFLAFTGKLK